MKMRNKLILGIATIAIAGIIIQSTRNHRINKRLARISDEGYELAPDILYPIKIRRKRINR
ncbi:MAG: hypothetical protein ABIQ56_01775 [Chitinophagaceae bacterium]